MVFIKLFAFVFYFIFCTNAFALDSFHLKVRTSYPSSMKTVYEATQYILEPTGYKLVISSNYAEDAYKISSLPITPMARTVRTMSIYDAMQALIGVNNTIVIDHENKMVSFLTGVHTNNSIERGYK